jgi:hypothetical protein
MTQRTHPTTAGRRDDFARWERTSRERRRRRLVGRQGARHRGTMAKYLPEMKKLMEKRLSRTSAAERRACTRRRAHSRPVSDLPLFAPLCQ